MIAVRIASGGPDGILAPKKRFSCRKAKFLHRKGAGGEHGKSKF